MARFDFSCIILDKNEKQLADELVSALRLERVSNTRDVIG